VNKRILELKTKEKNYLKVKQYKRAERMKRKWVKEEE